MLRKSTIALALALSTTLAAAPVAAQQSAYGLHAGELEVAINKSQVVTSDVPIEKAMIGNSEIADVLPISESSVYVLGKTMGTTSLTLYDRSNTVIAVMDISVGPDSVGIRKQIEALIPGQSIDVGLSNGSVVLSGMVSDAGAAARASRIAEAFAGEKVINLITVGGSQQVMLEVRFAEVSRTVGEELGAGGFLSDNDGDFLGAIGGGASATPGVTGGTQLGIGAVTESFGIFQALFNIGDINVEAFLDTLESKGLSKTLAEPTLVALTGERASFLAGGEFPVPVVQGGGGLGGGASNAITVEFKPFGVSLGFTPTVLGDNVINLVVEPEVSSIDSSASLTLNGITIPGLQTRRASTTIELRDGESFALAGLLSTDFETNISQLPILGSLPIIGSLFRSTRYQKGETELLIIVTPRLVKPIRPDQVRLPTDRIEDPDVVETLLNGDDYQPRDLPPSNAPAPSDRGGSDYEL
ncbi:type II and III secretion system protein family protein [Erythrobacter ani]|uniref:Type II and III secretion system protein family protein n=1 Tax=Erythrobacter ani TaxID=2827235 RepID=A0ABS6SLK7_9SPHN|nr:type II and III secretion system protein family protein [Erythrobacter ani]MBV7265861.1 type II and III secretion system protein family protein [Erythrobacter ani]